MHLACTQPPFDRTPYYSQAANHGMSLKLLNRYFAPIMLFVAILTGLLARQVRQSMSVKRRAEEGVDMACKRVSCTLRLLRNLSLSVS